MTETTTKTKTFTKCLKTQHMLYFLNPDDLLIPNMMIDTSPWPSCSSQSPWLPCSGHTISSTGPSVSPFRDFLLLYCTCSILSDILLWDFTLSVIWQITTSAQWLPKHSWFYIFTMCKIFSQHFVFCWCCCLSSTHSFLPTLSYYHYASMYALGLTLLLTSNHYRLIINVSYIVWVQTSLLSNPGNICGCPK